MLAQANKKAVVWKPLPGSQTLAMSCPAQVILYHGSRGPGKTDAQLMRFRRFVGQGFGKHWRGVIFDREYKNLDDLVAKSMRWFPEFKDGAKFLSSKSDYRWVWPSGEQLLFRTLKRPQDYWAYHGQEFPFIGWNELTKYPDDQLFEMMMSCNRSSYRPQDYPIVDERTGQVSFTPELPLEVFATTNPFGPGHNWVKKRFILPAQAGRIVRKTVNVFNPQTKERENFVTTQTHLFGSYKENIYLSPKYIAELSGMKDLNKRKAWLGGSWDVLSGGMFDDVWSTPHHSVEPFDIPHSWTIERCFDWGSSKPFSVGWWAVSDGSDYIDAKGVRRSSVRGDCFRIMEWYGTTGNTNEGLKLLAKQISAGIVERQLKVSWGHRVVPGAADNSIWDVVNGNSIARDMEEHVRINGTLYPGVQWRRSDKSPGSRIHGWEKLRTMLQSAVPPETGVREQPGLFCFNTCEHFLELFPVLPRDENEPDDVDTDAEDHIGDETRYMALDKNTGGRVGKTKGT